MDRLQGGSKIDDSGQKVLEGYPQPLGSPNKSSTFLGGFLGGYDVVRTPSPLNLPEADPPSLQADRHGGKVLQGRQVDRCLHLGSGDSFLDKEKKI